MLLTLFALSINAAEPIKTWDISATSSDNVTATLYDDYSLVISGTGNMKDWTSYPYAPWYSSYDDEIKSVTIEEGVATIGNYAFAYCDSLTSIVIPDSVTTIGSYAFDSCYSLTRVVIPDSVTTIGSFAFEDCLALTSVVIGDSVTSIGNSAFEDCDSLTSVVIGDSVTTIGEDAFAGCDSLTSIVIGNSVTTIGDRAFSGCDSLTNIVIPDSVTTIGGYAFYSCDSLTSIEVSENNTAYCDIDGNLYTKDKKTLIQYAIGKKDTSFTIPDSVTTIGERAFSNCDSLTSIVIPDSVTTIGNYAFRFCNSLTSILIPDSVTTIGKYAFYSCDSLTIYCEAASQPSGWNSDWNYSNCPVEWGHKHKNFIKNVIKEPICLENGLCEYICGDCGHKSIEQVLPNEYSHDYEDIFVPAQCPFPAYTRAVCKNCGYELPIVLPDEMVHNLSDEKIDHILPTYYTEESYYLKCIDCGALEKHRAPSLKSYFDKIFTYLGFSTNETTGEICCGFEINYSRIESCEKRAQKKIDFGVVFASYELLDGNQPLDKNGKPITLENGMVIVQDLKGYDYQTYNFALQGLTEELYDHYFVIAGYAKCGEDIIYYQSYGALETVMGVNYYGKIISGLYDFEDDPFEE